MRFELGTSGIEAQCLNHYATTPLLIAMLIVYINDLYMVSYGMKREDIDEGSKDSHRLKLNLV